MEESDISYTDPLLEDLIRIKEDAEERKEEHPDFPITLNVGGMLISGDLISKDTYLKDFLGGAILNAIQVAEDKDESLKQKMEKEAKEKPYNFIHLKNVKFFVPGQPPILFDQEDTLWRGRLTCVDGFIIGKLSATVR